MATKLKNLKVTKVDFVDEGANPDAHIRLFKSKDGSAGADDEEETNAAGEEEKEEETAEEETAEEESEEEEETQKRRKLADKLHDAVTKALGLSSGEDEASEAAAEAQAVEVSVPVADIDVMKAARSRLDQMIEETEADTVEKAKATEGSNQKGDDEMVDKSKMTPTERAIYEEIVKRYRIDAPNSAGVEKKATETDVYKGLAPEVKQELEELRKFRADAEEQDMQAVAKRYEILGKKADELVPVLKAVKAAGGTAYDEMISAMDQAVDLVEKSGAFSEIGKRGGNGDGNAWARAEAKAAEIMKSKAGMTKAVALDEVFKNDPQLARECEEEV